MPKRTQTEAPQENQVVLNPEIPAGESIHPVHTVKTRNIDAPVRGNFTRAWFREKQATIRMLHVMGKR